MGILGRGSELTFESKYYEERRDIEISKAWYMQKFKPKSIIDATIDEQRYDHFDWRIDGVIKAEVKHRDKEYDNILLEVVSSDNNNVPGWFYTSKADILVYITLNPYHTKVARGYVFKMNYLREWWKNRGKNFKWNVSWGHTPSRDGGILYNTKNFIIPLRKIPNDCYMYKGV